MRGEGERKCTLVILVIYSMLLREGTVVIFKIIFLDNFLDIPNILPIGMLLWKAGTGGIIKQLIFVFKCI